MRLPPDDARPCFTVLTPTYDRAHTLPGVYESLRAQTFRDFEWVIVDDGSTDGTAALVEGWQREADFPIHYLWQENRGKHVAFNQGVAHARGALLLTLDSDDLCLPETLERLQRHWTAIPEEARSAYSGITVHCMRRDGSLIGSPFPARIFDSTPVEMVTRHGMRGDKWGFQRTDLLREHTFPELPGERFVAEGLVWNRIARTYRTRYLDEPLQIKIHLSDGLTAASLRIRAESPRSARLYYREFMGWPLPARWYVRQAVNYLRFSFHAGIGWRKAVAESDRRLVAALLSPAGWLVHRWDRHRLR